MFDLATAYDPATGHEVDRIGGWETAMTMAQNHVVIVHRGDDHWSRSSLQSACDRERLLFKDCFGIVAEDHEPRI